MGAKPAVRSPLASPDCPPLIFASPTYLADLPQYSTCTIPGEFGRMTLVPARSSRHLPATRAEGLRIALRAYQPEPENPGLNLNSPAPPPPFIIPAAVCHYTPPPAARARSHSLSLERVSHSLFICHEYSTEGSAAPGCTKGDGAGWGSAGPRRRRAEPRGGSKWSSQYVQRADGTLIAGGSPVAQRTRVTSAVLPNQGVRSPPS